MATKTMTSRLIDLSLAVVIWFLALVAIGFIGRITWEVLMIGWRLI